MVFRGGGGGVEHYDGADRVAVAAVPSHPAQLLFLLDRPRRRLYYVLCGDAANAMDVSVGTKSGDSDSSSWSSVDYLLASVSEGLHAIHDKHVAPYVSSRFLSNYCSIGHRFDVCCSAYSLYTSQDKFKAGLVLAGEYAGGYAGQIIGASFGGLLGGIIGSIAGQVIGGWVASTLYDTGCRAASWAAGLLGGGSGGPGGIEFREIAAITGMENPLYGSSLHTFLFPIEASSMQAAMVRVASSFVKTGVRIDSVQQIFETFVHELANGILVGGAPPWVSLHFNADCTLYSVMDARYRSTLVG
jgi:hypothetical protein